MRFWVSCILFLTLGINVVYPQKTTIDTLKIERKDTLKTESNKQLYENIENFSEKSGFAQWVHQLLFRKPKMPSTVKNIQQEFRQDYQKYQGKIIRKVDVIVLDPFGFDEKDSTQKPNKKIEKLGNALHGRSKHFTIKSQLLFQKNTPLDSLMLKETERLLRSRKYVRRAMIRPVEISSVSDSVDVLITVLDSWSLIVDGELMGSRGKFRVRERNFLGLGHELSVLYRQKFNDFNENGYGVTYKAENIYNTYVNALVLYNFGYDNTFEKKWFTERPFFSPLAKWSGGTGYSQNQYNEAIYLSDSLKIVRPSLKNALFEAYGAYAIPVLRKKSNPNRIANLIVSARFKSLKYQQKPPNFIDTHEYYTDEETYLSKVTLSSIGFVQDRFIFRHGDIEDVTTGSDVFFTSGIFRKNNETYPYIGGGFNWANYTEKGYFSTEIEAGSLLEYQGENRGVIKWRNLFFSNIFTLGDWHFRQFFKTNFVIGLNRSDYVKDRINLNEEHGILGFRSDLVYGTRKFVFSSQTQAYSPFEWIGFRFSPFLIADIGFISNENRAFFKNDTYSKIGLGFYISNDYLVFSSFQISFCFFPNVPGSGTNIFRLAGIQNNDFGLQSFSHEAPEIINFE